MDIIILQDGLYHLIEVTKEMTEGHGLCLDLCDIYERDSFNCVL